MSRSARFLSGLSLGYVFLGLVAVVGFVMAPFLLRYLGQEQWGLWLAAQQFIGYLALLDLGTLALVPREIALAKGEGERGGVDLVSGSAARALQLILWQTPLLVAAALVTWQLLPARFASLHGPYALVLLGSTAIFPARCSQAVLDGVQDFRFLGRARPITWAVGTALTVAGVLRGFGLWALAAGWLVAEGGMALACGIRLHRLLPRGLRLERPGRAEALGLLRKGLWVSAGRLTYQLVMNSDLLIVGQLLGAAAVVPYACTGKLLSVLANQPAMLLQVAGPGLAELRGLRERDRLARARTALIQLTLLVSGALGVVVLAVNQAFVSRWIGAGQYGGGWLTLALVLAMVLRQGNTALATAVFHAGYEHRLTITGLIDAALSVAASTALCVLIGPAGVPLGSALGACAVSIPVNVVTLAREDGRHPLRWLAVYAPWAWRFAAVGATAVLLARQVTELSWRSVVGLAAAGGATYAAAMAMVALRPPVGEYVRPWLERLWRRLRRASPGATPT